LEVRASRRNAPSWLHRLYPETGLHLNPRYRAIHDHIATPMYRHMYTTPTHIEWRFLGTVGLRSCELFSSLSDLTIPILRHRCWGQTNTNVSLMMASLRPFLILIPSSILAALVHSVLRRLQLAAFSLTLIRLLLFVVVGPSTAKNINNS